MKKWLAKIFVGVFALMCLLGIAACDPSKKTGATGAGASVNGTYYFYSDGYVEEDYIKLANGRATAVFDGGNYQGTYTLSGTEITLTLYYEDDNEPETGTGKVANGVIFLWDGYYCKKGCVPSDIDKTTGGGTVGASSLYGRYYWYNGNGSYENGLYIEVKANGTCVLYDGAYGLTDGLYEIDGDDITLNFGDGEEVIEAFYYAGIIEDYNGDFYCQKGYKPENENLHGRYHSSLYGDLGLNSKGTWQMDFGIAKQVGTYQISGSTITFILLEETVLGETTEKNETYTGTISNGVIQAFDTTFEKVDMQFNG